MENSMILVASLFLLVRHLLLEAMHLLRTNSFLFVLFESKLIITKKERVAPCVTPVKM